MCSIGVKLGVFCGGEDWASMNLEELIEEVHRRRIVACIIVITIIKRCDTDLTGKHLRQLKNGDGMILPVGEVWTVTTRKTLMLVGEVWTMTVGEVWTMTVGEVLMTITQMTMIKKELRASQISRSS